MDWGSAVPFHINMPLSNELLSEPELPLSKMEISIVELFPRIWKEEKKFALRKKKFKSIHNTKPRKMSKGLGQASLGCGFRFIKCSGGPATATSESRNHRNTEGQVSPGATHCQGIQVSLMGHKATLWSKDLIPDTGADQPEARPFWPTQLWACASCVTFWGPLYFQGTIHSIECSGYLDFGQLAPGRVSVECKVANLTF